MKKIIFIVFVFLTSCSQEPKYNAQGWTPKYKKSVKLSFVTVLAASPVALTNVALAKKLSLKAEEERICDCVVNKFEKTFRYGMPIYLKIY
ncbi:MAG: hypothetical protein JWR12_2007 [Mucilaginibacter sp.]|nr:hypothetical protein [Mucilaginibacter sp.]